MMKPHVLLLLLTCASLLTTLSFSSDPVPNLRRPSPFRPLCVSQIALANYACTSVVPGLPFGNSPTVPSAIGTMPEPYEILYSDARQEDDNDNDDGESNGGGEDGQIERGSGGGDSGSSGSGTQRHRRHPHPHPHPRREHENAHGDGDGHNSGTTTSTPRHHHRSSAGHGGHRRHGHRSTSPGGHDGDDDNDRNNDDEGDDDEDDDEDNRELPPMSPAENNCCKWVRDVDDECVCELLMRLPTFLARPFHEYTITVSEWCKVTYSCGGRPRP